MCNVSYLIHEAMLVYSTWTIFIINHVGTRNVTSFHWSTISVYLARAFLGTQTCRYTQSGFSSVVKPSLCVYMFFCWREGPVKLVAWRAAQPIKQLIWTKHEWQISKHFSRETEERFKKVGFNCIKVVSIPASLVLMSGCIVSCGSCLEVTLA